jgi:hypothetical protein
MVSVLTVVIETDVIVLTVAVAVIENVATNNHVISRLEQES